MDEDDGRTKSAPNVTHDTPHGDNLQVGIPFVLSL